MAMLQVECLKKIYTTRFGGNQVQALSDVSFSVETGEYVAIMGESGSGKTTLLNILAALDQPTSGKVFLDGKDLTMVKEREIAAFRRDNLGFVFQDFNLLDTFSLKDNIFLPLVLAGKSPKEMELRLNPIAEQLGITHLLEKYPYEVSGGQKQRAAVARALISKPKLILADEPTGALDSKSTDGLLDVFSAIHATGQTILMVTHSTKAASRADRILFIKDGVLFNRMCKKENEAYFSEYHQVQQHNKQEQEQAEARSNWMRIDRKEDLKDWRSYCYQIDQKLRQLYQAQEIPKTYQGAIAMSLFVSYLQTGRCDTLKECMNKFDDDSAFYQLKGEIEEIIREIGEMKQRLSRELSFTRQCLNDDLENVELLVQKNQTQIEQISYNQETQRLLLATAFLEEQ